MVEFQEILKKTLLDVLDSLNLEKEILHTIFSYDIKFIEISDFDSNIDALYELMVGNGSNNEYIIYTDVDIGIVYSKTLGLNKVSYSKIEEAKYIIDFTVFKREQEFAYVSVYLNSDLSFKVKMKYSFGKLR